MSCSRKDFSTGAFGPVAWHHLHTVGFAFPDDPSPEEQADFASFLVYFTRTLPCGDCRRNFEEYIRRSFKPGTHLKSCDALSRWLFRAHNAVNAKLGKRVLRDDHYEVVKNYYLKMRDPKARSVIKLIL